MTTESPWQRLDTRTLLTGPIRALRTFAIPIGVAIIGVASGGDFAKLLFVVPAALIVAAVVGLVPWLTTSYRVTETHLEIRRGLLNRSNVTARLDRVRSVDLEASLIHRLLNIVTMKIGTGVDEGQHELDALDRVAAESLRRRLLHGTSDDGVDRVDEVAAPSDYLAQLEWSWLRFAPLNLLNLGVVIGGMIALASQAEDLVDGLMGRKTLDTVLDIGLPLIGISLIIGALILWIPLSCAAYAARWFNLRVSREQGKEGTTLHQQAGLFTTRSTTVEEAKVRGVQMHQQVLIGAAGGAELSLLTIGLEDNTPAILPAAPVAAVHRVAAEVLGDNKPLTMTLRGHGRRVLWRYLRRGVINGLIYIAVAVGATSTAHHFDVHWPWWATITILGITSVLAMVVPVLRYRKLGHAVTDRYLVAQSGALDRVRKVLESDGIVGWKVVRGPFDRHLSLAQLTATTAAGDEQITIVDVPAAEAAAVMAQATPRMVREFVTTKAP